MGAGTLRFGWPATLALPAMVSDGSVYDLDVPRPGVHGARVRVVVRVR